MYREIPPAHGVIIHPGAVGDCLLTLPLAAYMKKTLHLVRLDFIGKMDAIEFYPGRTCVDRVRSLDSLPLHRLFEDETAFVLDDKDRLLIAFEGYEQIVSFLGHRHPHFENNLLFCVHSTHSADVVMLPLTPAAEDGRHVADFYVDLFRQEQQLEEPSVQAAQTVVPFASDFAAGQELLEEAGVRTDRPVVIIQPGSGAREKCWPLQNFITTADLLKAQGIEAVFLLGPVEQERFEPEDLKQLSANGSVISNLELTQVMQILTQADAYLGNDSGISHLAAAMARPTVVLFGPASNPVHYRPLGEHVSIVQPERFSCVEQEQAERAVQIIAARL